MRAIGRRGIDAAWAVSIVVLAATPAGVLARAGRPDPSFGTGGRTTAPSTPASAEIYLGVEIEPDGRIVAAGDAQMFQQAPTILVTRYLADGSLDPTFGTGGVAAPVIPDFHNVYGDPARDLAGNVLIAGETSSATTPPTLGTFVLRLDPSGALDPTFGAGGIVTLLPDGPGGERVFGWPTLQPDGRIVLAGSAEEAASFVRLETDGSLDTSFGDAGTASLPLATGEGYLDRTIVLPDGKLVASGKLVYANGSQDVLVVRVDQTGSPDGAFGLGGVVITDLGGADDYGNAIVVQADQKLVVGGISGTIANTSLAIVRYDDSGALDPTFGAGGVVIDDRTPVGDYVDDLVVEPSGKIVIAGQTNADYPTASMLVARLHADGTYDDSFGIGGATVWHPTGQFDVLTGIARQPDGALVGVGINGFFDGVVARFLAGRCSDMPRTTCKVPAAARAGRLVVKRGVTAAGDTLVWKWRHGDATLAELGDPTTATDYAFCVYASAPDRLVYEASAYAATTCRGRACWKARGTSGFVYADGTASVDGVRKIALKAGSAGKASAAVKGKGTELAGPALPLALPSRVQLQASNGTCFDATFSTSGASVATATKFVGKSD